MFETQDGRLLHSVVMIDQEQDILNAYRNVFHNLCNLKFFTMTMPDLGVATAEQYQADLIITEIYFPKFDFYDGELLIEELRRVRPEAKIMIYSVHSNADIIYKYKMVFGVDSYVEKLKIGLEEMVQKVYELLNEPYPF